jgi:hypothetical protein
LQEKGSNWTNRILPTGTKGVGAKSIRESLIGKSQSIPNLTATADHSSVKRKDVLFNGDLSARLEQPCRITDSKNSSTSCLSRIQKKLQGNLENYHKAPINSNRGSLCVTDRVKSSQRNIPNPNPSRGSKWLAAINNGVRKLASDGIVLPSVEDLPVKKSKYRPSSFEKMDTVKIKTQSIPKIPSFPNLNIAVFSPGEIPVHRAKASSIYKNQNIGIQEAANSKLIRFVKPKKFHNRSLVPKSHRKISDSYQMGTVDTDKTANKACAEVRELDDSIVHEQYEHMQLRSELDLTRKECQSTNREILIKISRELELKDPNLDLGPSIDGLQVSKGDLIRMDP